MNRLISFSPPDITDIEIDEVVDTLKSGWITTGPKTKLFENKITEYCGSAKSACFNSATTAMETILRILNVGEGDEVITTAYTYTASASVIEHVGAEIVLVDTEKDSFTFDYEKLEQAITEKTKVIISVDLAGIMCEYDKIFDIVNSKKHLFKPNGDIQERFGRIIVLADSAHGFGSDYNGRKSGSVADFTSFSFHAVKNLTTAEGGAVTWAETENIDDDDIYNKLMINSLHGQTKDALKKVQLGSWDYDIVVPGYKANMTDITASLGLGQLKRYPALLKRRKEIIERYNAAFAEENVQFLNHYTQAGNSSGHLYIIRVLDKTEQERNEIIERMAEKGIGTNVHYKPLPMFTAYKNMGFKIEDYPNAYNFYHNEITLPLHTLLSDDDVEYIIENFKKIINL